jgi:6-pyruvoyl-tetrahydropterin synthase
MQLFVNQLTNVDFSYLDSQRCLVGETWLASASLLGALDHQGMVCDFGIVKKTLRNWLDDELDHRLLVPALSANLLRWELCANDQKVELTWQSNKGPLTLDCPTEAVALIQAESITAESVAQHAIQVLKPSFPINVDQLRLNFESEHIASPYYHYSHGLKKHQGNCQRIAHGHRSRIEIWQNGSRSEELERHWANLWADIYIGSYEDLSSQARLDQGGSTLTFEYQAPQGEFRLSLPKDHCYLIDSDTTVELIAAHIGAELAAAYPDTEFCVRAYEGINKGAQVEVSPNN